jgi:hypothetical protein
MTTDSAIDRLRAAKPLLPSSTVDAEALFTRITVAAPDRRLRTSKRRHRRPVLVFVVALALVAVIASTALALSGWIGEVIGPSEVNSEFAKAESQLRLPPGYTWPKFNFPKDSVTSPGAGGAFAVNMAQSAWECYWVQSIGRRDITGQQTARAALSDLMANHIVVAPNGASENWSPPPTGKPLATYADDGGYQYKQRMYAQAAVGRPKLLEQSCRANAPPGWAPQGP